MYVQKENEEWQANYDESQVPPFTLPELLKASTGVPSPPSRSGRPTAPVCCSSSGM